MKKQKTNEAGADSVKGFPVASWGTKHVKSARAIDVRSGERGFLFVVGALDVKLGKKILSAHLQRWQLETFLGTLKGEAGKCETKKWDGKSGPVWLVWLDSPAASRLDGTKPTASAQAMLEKSREARVRDGVGALLTGFQASGRKKIVAEFIGLTDEEEKAALVGLEIASYSFRRTQQDDVAAKAKEAQILLKTCALKPPAIREAFSLGWSVNLARHLISLPANELNPKTYAELTEKLFVGSSTVDVEIWEGERLKKEKTGLLIAVGQAAGAGSRLVHLRYRPKQKSTVAPIALVGKGITFDSGGLDIKPSAGMRIMKKDMGGSAGVLAILKWAELNELPIPLDGYLAMAENAIAGNAFRPGDVLVARNGLRIEISNTDAEGRLVLGDALDVAIHSTEGGRPQAVIDLATLTGAIKVGLGAEVAGLFSNDDRLASRLADAGLATGDLMWRMPLLQNYRGQLKSNFADMVNSTEIAFGGAITAALFLQAFVGDVPWAHLDMYAWRDSAGGAFSEAGGSGQGVLAVTRALRDWN